MRTEIKHIFLCFTLTLFMGGEAALVRAADGPGFSLGETAAKSAECMACHGSMDKVGEKMLIDPAKYAQTNHARIGCPSCHEKVVVQHTAGGFKSEKADCVICHSDIGAEYAASSHGAKAGCGGCHDPHKVNSPNEVSGKEINRMCAGCHDNNRITASHAKWLPQADLHIEMLPCITCHTSSQNYVINMYIIKRQQGERFGKLDLATYKELQKIAGEREIISLLDVNQDNYVSLDELRNFNRNYNNDGMRLKAMMTPEKVTHSFQILDNRRNCTFCHASGPGVMQTSYITLPGKDGVYQQTAVEKGAVLDALNGTPDFYMTGKTRNSALNNIGLLIIAGGFVMPVGHGFLRFLSRNIRNRKEKDHE